MEEKNRLYDTAEEVQKFILVAVEDDDPQINAEQSLDELADLLRTAGGEEAGRLIQRREAPHPGTYLGSGKIE
jgi:GTP-binding protein HflX